MPQVTTRHRCHIKGERRRHRRRCPPGGALRAPLWGRFAFTAPAALWAGDSGRLDPSCPQVPAIPLIPATHAVTNSSTAVVVALAMAWMAGMSRQP